MNWIAFTLINLTWVVTFLLMRRRYRRLMREALDTLDYVHDGLTPYVGHEGQMRTRVGKVLSDLCVESGIDPLKRRGSR